MMFSAPKSRLRASVAAAVLALAGGAASAREIRACGHHDYPPWNWVSTNARGNEIAGACADVTRRVFEHLGHTVNLAYVGPWKRCQALVQNGEVDVNICSFRNPEREAYSRFVEVPMGINPIAIFVKKGREFTFEKWADLAGRHSGVVNGVSMGPEFDSFLTSRTHVEIVSEPVLNLRKLAAERLDFVPLGLEAGLLQTQMYGFTDAIVPLPKPALDGKLYISISNHAVDLQRQIPEIERYLSRPEYRAEIVELLKRNRERYVRENRDVAGAKYGPPAR